MAHLQAAGGADCPVRKGRGYSRINVGALVLYCTSPDRVDRGCRLVTPERDVFCAPSGTETRAGEVYKLVHELMWCDVKC